MKSLTRVAYHSSKYEGWYNNDPAALAKEIGGYLSRANKEENSQFLKSIIVPHAGYRFCGNTAANAFINIDPNKYSRLVVLGPSHHASFEGCGLSPFSIFETPFGDIPMDLETKENLLNKRGSHFFTLPQSIDIKEHSIEMEMPFLKYIFGDKKLKVLPIMVGNTDLNINREIGSYLYPLYEDPETLFVISSDFCHWGKNFEYTFYNKNFSNIWESIQDLDKQALDIIGEMDSEKFDKYFKKTKNTICGRNPISIILTMIEKYRAKNKDKKVSFLTTDYSQSNKVKSFDVSSVSYAAAANFVSD